MEDFDEGFLKISKNPQSLTGKICELFQVEASKVLRWTWHLQRQLRTQEDFQRIYPPFKDQALQFQEIEKRFHGGITPYYGALIHEEWHKNPLNSGLAFQVLPNDLELQDRWGAMDPLKEKEKSPVPEVVHLYPERVAFCVASLCPVYCRYCFRKRRDQEEIGLHFNPKILDRGLDYIASQKSIRDVLVTGGDPLMASTQALVQLLERLRAIPHVEVIRIGSRVPVALPYRISREFAKTLSSFGPLWFHTHFNAPSELTQESRLALSYLADAGLPLGNQSVLLKGVNDDPKILAELFWELVKSRVRPYYLFHPHAVDGTEHLRVPLKTGMRIMKTLRGRISGMAIPTYILETPSGKVPIYHQHILGEQGDDVLIEDIHGEVWREIGAAHES